MATTYSYTARSMTGNEVTGLHVGENVDEVVSYLHSRDLAVLKVETDKRRGETALPDWFNITIGSQASTRGFFRINHLWQIHNQFIEISHFGSLYY